MNLVKINKFFQSFVFVTRTIDKVHRIRDILKKRKSMLHSCTSLAGVSLANELGFYRNGK